MPVSSQNSGEANTVLYSVVSPFSVEVMDADFAYSSACSAFLRKFAREQGYELTDLIINLIFESELDHKEETKAIETGKFEIHRMGERIIGVYQSKNTIRSQQS